MQKIFEQYDIELSPKELQKFEKFLELFMEKNSHINLSAIREKDAIIEKHFVDSLMLAALYDIEGKVADL
jgi:16S rRNA (guanine527-N7)-methyltransferase